MKGITASGVLAILFAAQLLTTAGPATAGHPAKDRSDNLAVVADGTEEILCTGKPFTNHGGDISFVGDKAIVLCGNDDDTIYNDGFVVVDISDPADPTEIGRFACAASASDLAVWGNLVFLAVDRNGETRGGHAGPYSPGNDNDCAAPSASFNDRSQEPGIFRGIRIVSIADPTNPRLITSLRFGRAGAHTVTVLPDGPRNGGSQATQTVYVFGSSPTDRKNAVIEVPVDDPASARITMVDHYATFGCHDISFFVPRGLAACAGVDAVRYDREEPTTLNLDRPLAGASLLDVRDDPWDHSDDGAGPTTPKLVATIDPPYPSVRFHSAAFSWDGNTLVLSDENMSTTPSWSCETDADQGLAGGLWFYDVSDLSGAGPKVRGYQQPHFVAGNGWCTSTNFNVIPLDSGRDVLVAAWYGGGTTVVDFTDPTDPEEIAYFVADPGDRETGSFTRAAYWYDGLIYINNVHGCLAGALCVGPTERGLDILRLDAGLDGAIPMDRFDMGLQECLPARSGPSAGTVAACSADPRHR